MTARRLAVAAGAVGLVGGLALGATGLATAAGSSPTPSPQNGTTAGPQDHGGRWGGHLPGRGGGRGEALVVSFTDHSLVVRTPRGERTVALTAATAYTVDGVKATRAALRTGVLVHVRLVDRGAAKPVAAEVRVVPAHLEGYVTRVDGSTFTVLDTGGFARTVTTSGTTAFSKDGASSTITAFPVGTFVRASGTAAGTDLAATRVATGRPAAGDRPGGAPGLGGRGVGDPGADGGPGNEDGPQA